MPPRASGPGSDNASDIPLPSRRSTRDGGWITTRARTSIKRIPVLSNRDLEKYSYNGDRKAFSIMGPDLGLLNRDDPRWPAVMGGQGKDNVDYEPAPLASAPSGSERANFLLQITGQQQIKQMTGRTDPGDSNESPPANTKRQEKLSTFQTPALPKFADDARKDQSQGSGPEKDRLETQGITRVAPKQNVYQSRDRKDGQRKVPKEFRYRDDI